MAVEPYESKADVILAVVQLLNYWKQKVEEAKPSEVIYLPIDFSDQYTGCLQVEKQENKNLSLCYGWTTEFEGWRVNPVDPGDYYKSIQHFQSATAQPLVVDEKEFLSSLSQQIQKLTSRIQH